MPSEKLASAENLLKGNLASAWNILEGSSGDYTDLGIARRFGDAAAAYSLRDIGAMNGRVVRVRREPYDTNDSINDEETFSANQVSSGALEDWVNGKLEDQLPADKVAVEVAGGSEVAGKYYSRIKYSSNPEILDPVFVYYNDDLAVPLKLLRFSSGTSQRWRFERQDNNAAVIDPTNRGTVYNSPADVPISDWVGTGNLAITSITKVSQADAAYSLRKVNDSYSGNAVRIRRTSDDVEVNVAFDSDDKVSLSSSVTNTTEQGGESGSTTATDLNGFLNESTENFSLTPYASINAAYQKFSSTPTLTETSLSATSGSLSGGTARLAWALPSQITSSDYDTLKIKVTGTINSITGYRLLIKPATANDGDSVFTPEGGHKQLNVGDTGDFEFTFEGNLTSGGSEKTFRAIVFVFEADGMSADLSNLKFEIIEHGATVHTWYDQAGTNDATQATAANQPKIAENGALLADGIDFDGTNHYLEANGLSSIYTGTDEAHSSFVVVNSDAASATQYILGIGSSTTGNPLRNTLFHSGGNIGWQVRDDAGTLKTDLSANPYVANQTYLVSALNSGTTIDFNTNSVINDNGTDADVGASTINTVHIGTRANSPTDYLNGSIQELVFYATDQSANRFKIESNINNYYGLYNDANEMATDWSDDPTAPFGDGFTSNGKDGFTIAETGSGSKRARWQFNINVPSGSVVYYSFNANITNGTPAVILKQSNGSSNAASTSKAISNGFNSNSITANATAVYFAIGDTEDPQNYSISDFKVSLITRNGFVETWYDQSSSGNNATQTAATKQPRIVQNGGIIKNVKGFPSLQFESSRSTEFTIGKLIDNINSASAYVVQQKDTGDTSRMAGFAQGTSSNNSRFYLAFYHTNGSLPNFGYNDSATKISFGTTATGTCNMYSAFSGDTNIEAFKNGSSVGTTALVDQANTTTNSKIGAIGSSFLFDGKMSEIFITTKKLQDDAATINSDVTSYYNL